MSVIQESANISKPRLKKEYVAWLFLAPGIIFTLILRYYPIGKTLLWSFFNYEISSPPGKFVGLDNYIDLLTNSRYIQSWKNTLIFLFLTLLIGFFVPIIQAIFLSEIIKGKSFFSTIYIIPALIPLSINIVLWKWIWHPDYGMANYVLSIFHVDSQIWLSNPALTKLCIVFPGVIGGGVTVLLYLAAIMGISKDIYEAAKVDGCVGFKKLFFITIPNIKYIFFIQLVLSVIATMQILDAPYQFAKGGPNGSSTSAAIFIYKQFAEDFAYGKSSAASIILLFVVGVITFLQLKMDKSENE